MNNKEMGHRALVLGAGVLLIGSLGVGSASATSYTNNDCVEISNYYPRPSTDNSTGSAADGSTDTPGLDDVLDPLDEGADQLTEVLDEGADQLTEVLDEGAGTGEPTTGEPTTGEPTTGEPTTGEPTTGEPATGLPIGPASSPSGIQNLRAEDTPTDGGGDANTDADLDYSGATLTTTDQGDHYSSGYSYARHGRSACYVNSSVNHYYYKHRPVGEVYATQVRSVPVGGVDTGN
jgi:hypothetical protein